MSWSGESASVQERESERLQNATVPECVLENGFLDRSKNESIVKRKKMSRSVSFSFIERVSWNQVESKVEFLTESVVIANVSRMHIEVGNWVKWVKWVKWSAYGTALRGRHQPPLSVSSNLTDEGPTFRVSVAWVMLQSTKRNNAKGWSCKFQLRGNINKKGDGYVLWVYVKASSVCLGEPPEDVLGGFADIRAA